LKKLEINKGVPFRLYRILQVDEIMLLLGFLILEGNRYEEKFIFTNDCLYCDAEIKPIFDQVFNS